MRYSTPPITNVSSASPSVSTPDFKISMTDSAGALDGLGSRFDVVDDDGDDAAADAEDGDGDDGDCDDPSCPADAGRGEVGGRGV